MIPLFLLMRPLNSLLASAGVFVGYALVPTEFGLVLSTQLFMLAVAAYMITAYGNVINDIADIDVDRINRPSRALPCGAVSTRVANNFSFFLLLIGLSFARAVNFQYFFVTLCIATLLWIYSFYLKGTILWGNLIVALLSAVTIPYGALLNSRAVTDFFWPFAFAFIIHFCREIVKDIADVEGDKSCGLKTLPIAYGIPFALRIVVASMFLLTILIPLPWLTGRYSLLYLLISFPISVAATVYSVLVTMNCEYYNKKKWDNFSNILKLVMMAGIVAVVSGS